MCFLRCVISVFVQTVFDFISPWFPWSSCDNNVSVTDMSQLPLSVCFLDSYFFLNSGWLFSDMMCSTNMRDVINMPCLLGTYHEGYYTSTQQTWQMLSFVMSVHETLWILFYLKFCLTNIIKTGYSCHICSTNIMNAVFLHSTNIIKTLTYLFNRCQFFHICLLRELTILYCICFPHLVCGL